MEERVREIAQLLKVLANENRLMILCKLIEGPKTVSALGEKIPAISQSALSQHLAQLKAYGILDSKKEGQCVTYFVLDHRVEEVLKILRKHYCSPDEEGLL